MVEISLSGSGEGPGRATDRGYSTNWRAKALAAGCHDSACYPATRQCSRLR